MSAVQGQRISGGFIITGQDGIPSADAFFAFDKSFDQ
jgi:hypothetical protein